MRTLTQVGDETTALVVLDAVRAARVAREQADVDAIVAAVAWAGLHVVEDIEDACVFSDSPIPVAGPGAPLIGDAGVAEYASAIRLPHQTGKHLLGEAVELAYRLPKTYARLLAGKVSAYRARRVAQNTIGLSQEAASFVDSHVANYAHKIGLADLERLCAAAVARFMPQQAKELAEQAGEGRYLVIDTQQISYDGTSHVHGELDLADALDLEAAIKAGAAHRSELGSTESLNVRRAQALGDLARGQHPLFYAAADPGTDTDNTVEAAVPTASAAAAGPVVGRSVELFVHISQLALNGCTCGAGLLARTETGSPLVTADQVAQWCGRPDTARVRVRPVIDLNHCEPGTRYEIPGRVREAVILRDRTCVFPWCTRNARGCDLDHTTPHNAGGQTCACNLAPLCRRHHRLKTHTRWRYRSLSPGVYQWTSPNGLTFTRDTTGTTHTS